MGNPSVFVSHSKFDEDQVNFFSKITARIGVPTHLMELEDIRDQEQGNRIAEIIRSNSSFYENTQLLVVLLGPNLEHPPTPTPQYTYSWVNFEVGVAAGCNKPVLVLEEANTLVNFPIPYLTDYFQYQMTNIDNIRQIGEIIKKRLNFDTSKSNSIKCPYSNCNAVYNIWSRYSNTIHCPSCRQVLTFK